MEEMWNAYQDMEREIIGLKKENGRLRETMMDLQCRSVIDNLIVIGISEVFFFSITLVYGKYGNISENTWSSCSPTCT